MSLVNIFAFFNMLELGVTMHFVYHVFHHENAHFFLSDSQMPYLGIFLGLLLSIPPIAEGFFSTTIGRIFDRKGQKTSFSIGAWALFLGNVFGLYAVYKHSIIALMINRLGLGIGLTHLSVVKSALSEIESKEERLKRFGQLNFAIGLGSMMGPLIGIKILKIDNISEEYFLVFIIGLILSFISFFLMRFLKKENTLTRKIMRKRDAKLTPLFYFFFAAMFFFCLGWYTFNDYAPVLYRYTLDLTSGQVGLFIASRGLIYAFAGILIVSLLSKFQAKSKLLFTCLLLQVATIILTFFIPNTSWLIPHTIVTLSLTSVIFALANDFIAEHSPTGEKGVYQGIFMMLYSIGWSASCFCFGPFIVHFPYLSVVLGIAFITFASLLCIPVLKKTAAQKEENQFKTD